MYIYFDNNGTLKEIITDRPFRVGDVKRNKIYVYWEGDHTPASGWVKYRKPDGTETTETSFYSFGQSLVEKELPDTPIRNLKYFSYDHTYVKNGVTKVGYQFYEITVPEEVLNSSLDDTDLVPTENNMIIARVRFVMIDSGTIGEIDENDTIETLGAIMFSVETNVGILTDTSIDMTQYNYLIAEIGKKIGLDNLRSVKVDELPQTGETGTIYYVKIENEEVYDVYYWNALTTTFIFIGTTSCGLYTQEEGTTFETEINDRLDDQDERITTEMASITQPKYYDVDSLPTADVGLVVGSDGYIYSWDSTNSEYVSTGIPYQATIDNNDVIVEPTLRNGSIGNVNNANAVCFVNTLGFNNTKGCFVKINYTLPSGYNFYIELDTNSVSNVPVNTNVVESNYRPYIRTTKNYFYIDFNQFSSSAVAFSMAIYVRKTDDTDFIPLRIATNQYCVSIIYNYELNGKTVDEISNMIISPVFRNGTISNEGNSDYVCTKKSYGFNGAKGMWIKINKELPTGYKFYMQCNINSAIGVNPTSNVVYEYRPLLRTSKNLFYWQFPTDITNAVAFSMDFTMKKDDDTENISLRIEQDLEIFFIYDMLGLNDNNEIIYKPQLRNGSIGNVNNAHQVTNIRSIPTNEAIGVTIMLNVPLQAGYEYYLEANLNLEVGVLPYNNVVQEYRPLGTTTKKYFYWEFPKGTTAKAFSISIAMFPQGQTTSADPIRIENYPNAYTIIYNYIATSNYASDEITTRILNARHIIRDYGTPLTLLHISDLHKDTGALAEILEDANNYSTYIDGKICTGDMVANTYEQISSWWDSSIMTCMGNHDTATYDSETGYDWTALSMANRSAYYIEPFKSNWGGVVHTNGKSYYYKDYTTQKVRLIVMDGMLYTDGGQDATDQNTWLTDLLADAITNNLHVLIAIHSPHNGSKAIPCSFSRYNQTDIPENWDTSCVTPQSVIDIVSTKKANGLHFIGYIVGHTHQDNIWDAVGDKSQLMYCITTASNSKPQWTGYDLYKGTGRNAYNLITIDTYNTLIKIIRCGGANVDDHMRKREMICFNYSNGDIVS